MQQHDPEVAKMSDLFSVWGDKEQIKRQLYAINWANLYSYFITQPAGDTDFRQQILSGR